MEPTSWRQDPGLGLRLADSPWEFEFFQAVRLLQHMAAARARAGEPAPSDPFSQDSSPRGDSVRFRAQVSLGFPGAAVDAIVMQDTGVARMDVSFLGAIGPSGVLPQHYTELVLQRLHGKDTTLRDFLDVLHHRATANFYRAWKKYRVPFELEERLQATGTHARREDPFTLVLRALVGLGTDGLKDRQKLADWSALFFAGHLSRRARSLVGIEGALTEYFGMPMRVEQFVGRWVEIPPDERSAMPTRTSPAGRNCRLGLDLSIGDRVWEVGSKIRVHAGPIGYESFLGIVPGSPGARRMSDLLRSFLGPGIDYDVEAELLPNTVPALALGSGVGRLGRNGWLMSEEVCSRPLFASFALDAA